MTTKPPTLPSSPVNLALALAAAGWHIFPLSPRKIPLANCPRCHPTAGCDRDDYAACPCLPAGRWCHGVRAATTNFDRITAWWRQAPTAVPAVAAGPSGLVLIDLDTHTDQPPPTPATQLLPGIPLTADQVPGGFTAVRNGRDALLLLARLRGGSHPWPATPDHQPVSVVTPSGGRHLWYRAPRVPNGTRLRQALSELGWQIDIKAGWSYGIAPGATTLNGTYRVIAGDPSTPGDMPEWLAREVLRVATTRPTYTAPPRPPAAAPGNGRGPAAYLTTVINRGAAELATLTDGRKRALSALAYKTGGLLAWSGLPHDEVQQRLLDAALAAGLNERLARRIIHRALTNGLSRPLPAPVPRRKGVELRR